MSTDLTPANAADTSFETATMSYYADGQTYESGTPAVPSYGALTTRYAYDQVGNPTRVWSPAAVANVAPDTPGTSGCGLRLHRRRAMAVDPARGIG